jgi:outer membrane usher protein
MMLKKRRLLRALQFLAYHGATFMAACRRRVNISLWRWGLDKTSVAIGALSADVTQAWSRQEDAQKENGQSWRLRYGKSFVETGTNFSLASYRYSTSGFYTLQEALESYAKGNRYYSDHKKVVQN